MRKFLAALPAAAALLLATPVVAQASGPQLVFSESFSGTRLDGNWASSWFGGGDAGSVRTSPANVRVSGGDLVLTLSNARTGALVDTDPAQTGGRGFTFGTGYTVKARVWFSGDSRGDIWDWQAFWATSDRWPADGEVDVAEGLGGLTVNYHGPSGGHSEGSPAGDWSGWHTYALVRDPGRNWVYWDGRLVSSYATDDDGGPEYLVFSIGTWPVARTVTGPEMKVAWVQAWRN